MALWRGRTASWNLLNRLLHPPSPLPYRNLSSVAAGVHNQSMIENMKRDLLNLDINSQIGSCMPLASMRIGTIIHNIEVNPGQGGKLVRAAGTSAKILKEPKSRYCLIRMPSGVEKLIDSRCRATVGTVSNPSHGAKKLRKAGQSRWLGRRPTVRGVAMNQLIILMVVVRVEVKVVGVMERLRVHLGASLLSVGIRPLKASAESSA